MHLVDIAKHTKVDVIWFAGRNPTSVAQNLKATTLTYLAITLSHASNVYSFHYHHREAGFRGGFRCQLRWNWG